MSNYQIDESKGLWKQITPTLKVDYNKTLGHGSFGVVYNGAHTKEDGNQVQVAVKKISTKMNSFEEDVILNQNVEREM